MMNKYIFMVLSMFIFISTSKAQDVSDLCRQSLKMLHYCDRDFKDIRSKLPTDSFISFDNSDSFHVRCYKSSYVWQGSLNSRIIWTEKYGWCCKIQLKKTKYLKEFIKAYSKYAKAVQDCKNLNFISQDSTNSEEYFYTEQIFIRKKDHISSNNNFPYSIRLAAAYKDDYIYDIYLVITQKKDQGEE